MKMMKLNPMGKAIDNRDRVVSVQYGHGNPNLKMNKVYSYLAGPGVRTGDIVTPTVTHPKSGKEYTTMGKVMNRRVVDKSAGKRVVDVLGERGVTLKRLGPTDVTQLPTFKERSAEVQEKGGPEFTGKQWAQESKARHRKLVDDKIKSMRPVNIMGEEAGGKK